jgi:aspartyl-tRNA(Asn)/glutamyl-tRNA(Gln) amidotransferase subunit A
LNASIEVRADEAKAAAQQIDKKIVDGTAGKLAGMVIGIKNNICYQNLKVSVSSKIIKNLTSLYSAKAVERLLTEGAITIVG